MYAWKCWRETRTRFFLLLTLSLGLPSLAICFIIFARTNGQFSSLGRLGHEELRFLADGIREVVIGFSGMLSLTAGLLLGATALGNEFEKDTIEYLWTRPRKRANFTWTHWLVCIAELSVVLSAAPVFAACVLSLLLGSLGDSRVLLFLPLLSILGGVFYLGLTILMTALRRGGTEGFVVAAGAVAIYGFVSEAALYYLHVRGVTWLNAPLTGWQFATHLNGHAFPWSVVLRIAVLAFAFVFLAQYRLKHAEV
jgi:ABC-type transport system involved in multi-copper enzyme maturation permease subunit